MSNDANNLVNIESVIIEQKESKLSTEIANGVSDIDIFEHLDKPYLTAVLGYTDRDSVVSLMNISGGEKIHIKLKSNRPQTVSVSKTFFIDKIILSDKSTELSELYVFHLIEDIGYMSNLKNVNRPYSGKPSEIISTISKAFLDTTVVHTGEVHQSMKVIIPNLTPIDAMCWIKNRASTGEGYPYYLYSTLVDKELQMKDLHSLMTPVSMNPKTPYSFTGASLAESSSDRTTSDRTIIRYQSKDTENLFKLIQEGLIGSEYRYINVTKNKVDTFSFNVDTEVITRLKTDNIIDKGTPLFDNSKYKDITADMKSRSISQIGGSSAIEGGKSYSESGAVAQYKFNIINRAMTHMLTKSKIDFVLEGTEFLDGNANKTLGRKISLRFLRNKLEESSTNIYDRKKSGDFLIFACKHSISRDSYYVTMSGVKLSNGEVQ